MPKRILIVDDEKQLVHTLRQMLLLELPGSKIDAAYSGEEALSKLADGPYDLIVADLRMPGFDGLELIKGVRYLDGAVPIILMTGYGSQGVAHEAARLGVDHYVAKPFNVREMMEIIHQLLAREDACA
ncbi:MAG: response regulator [Anaerolineae bacterium]|nr:response regulator [Anaerolineae bacterium]